MRPGIADVVRLAGNSVDRAVDLVSMIRLAASLLLVLAVAACASDDAVSVADPWARTSAPGQTQGAIYFDVTAVEDDRLVGASVPSSVATGAEIHAVVMDDGDAEAGSHDMDEMSGDAGEMSGDTGEMMEHDSGMMTMRELPDGVSLEAGETVSFEPGSYHVMMPELAEPLVAGEEFELTLEFAEAGAVTVTVQVADSAP